MIRLVFKKSGFSADTNGEKPSEIAGDDRFGEFRKKILGHLDSLEKAEEEKDKSELKKSLALFDIESIAKSGKGLPIGTIREWKGKKYIKVAQGKWRPKYDGDTRGAKMAVAALKRKAAQCKSSEELLHLVLENRDRFSDTQGQPLPFVRELSDYVSELNEKIESAKTPKKGTPIKSENKESANKDEQNKKLEEYAEKLKKRTEAQIKADIAVFEGYKNTMPDLLAPLELAQKELEKRKAAGSDGGDDGKEPPKPIGKGEFGDIYDCFKGKTQDAIEFLLKKKSGEATGALHHKDIGDIDLVYGEEGTSHSNGFGLAKLAKYHPEVLNDLQGVIDGMEVVKRTKNRIQLENKEYKASVRLSWNEKKKTWLLTAFKKSSDVFGNTTDTAETQQSRRNDTATPTNTADNSSIPQPAKKSSDISTIREKYRNSQSIDGDDDTITLPDGTELEGKWKLVEADAPSASHDETTFRKTEGFPTNEDGSTINDRDYEHDSAAKEAVLDIASDFDARALHIDSPVVVSEDGVVISGNNRTMSSKLAAKKGTDKKYVEALNKKAKKFGFTSDDVAKFKNPRVVFETKVDGKYSTKQFAQFNQSGKKAQSPVETAVKIAKTVDTKTVESIADRINQYDTLGELYADNRSMRDVFNTLIESDLIKKTDLPAYFTEESGVTNNGKEFLETVLVGSVINENNIRSLASPGGKEIRQKLVRAIVPLVENKGMSGYSITRELNDAVGIAVDIKKNKKFKDAESYARQGVLIGENPDPIAIEFAKKLEGTQKEFADFMRSLNVGLKPAANGEADIFLGGIESRDEILSRYMTIKKAISELFETFVA